MKSISANTRVSYIDIAKGLGMLAVIWGHIMLSGFTNTLIYAVHMPLFFFLSGMVYKKEKYSSLLCLIKSRIKSLLIPYVIFSILTWALWAVYNLIFDIEVDSYIMPLLQTFIAQGSGGYMEHNVPLWFVTCLFVVEVLYYFISKTRVWINLTICSIMTVIGYFMIHNTVIAFDFTKLPWNIEVAFTVILFFAVGNLLTSKYSLKSVPNFISNKKAIAWTVTAITALIVCVGSYFNGSISIAHNNLGKNTIVFYFIAFCGIALTLLISGFLEKGNFKILEPLKWIGRNSFYFMSISVPADGIVSAVIKKLFNVTDSIIKTSWLYCTIIFVITLVSCCITVIIINKLVGLLKRKQN